MADDGEMSGKITEDGIQRYRNRLGVLARREAPYNYEATEDSIRQYAVYACGDDNPLFTNPAYAAATRWGGVIAPPAYVQTMGVFNSAPIPKEVRDAGRGALSGVPNYNAGNRWEFYEPVVPGDRLERRFYISKVEEKRSDFGGGRSVFIHHTNEYINQHGRLAASLVNYFFHVERQASQKRGKNLETPLFDYDDDYLARIDEAYKRERPRGAEQRYWEDVAEGQELDTIVRGPLTTTDIICWHMGQGMGQFNVKPLRLGYLNRRKTPNFYTKNPYGVWDAAQRVHWENDRPKVVGMARAYDYGRVRTQWLLNLLSNWVGDDGWIFKSYDETRKFNYHADTSWVQGKVVKKWADGPDRYVEIEAWIENQRREVTTTGRVTALLPSRQHGPVRLPSETGRHNPAPMKNAYSVEVPPP